jgi:hypothetical protein
MSSDRTAVILDRGRHGPPQDDHGEGAAHSLGELCEAYGRHGPARVRRGGRGVRQRWFVMAPLESGELLTCVFRAVLPRDLETEGVFVISSAGRREAPATVDSSMRLCVSARMSDQDEVRSYRRWRESKGGR